MLYISSRFANGRRYFRVFGRCTSYYAMMIFNGRANFDVDARRLLSLVTEQLAMNVATVSLDIYRIYRIYRASSWIIANEIGILGLEAEEQKKKTQTRLGASVVEN